MATPVIYADLNLPRAPECGSVIASSLPPPPDVCHRPYWRRRVLRLSCACVTLLVLGVVGLSVAVVFLTQKSPTKESSVDIQENRTEGPVQTVSVASCPVSWQQRGDKCLLFLSSTSVTWRDSLADCSTKESSLLLIRDPEELRLLQKFLEHDKSLYWIGLNHTLREEAWKWINGSAFNPTTFQMTGDSQAPSCAHISHRGLYAESCDSEIQWICQKELPRQKSQP
ncbi:killer cell lectin-like receptor subfamily B member 1B allele A [Thomomys bottae]